MRRSVSSKKGQTHPSRINSTRHPTMNARDMAWLVTWGNASDMMQWECDWCTLTGSRASRIVLWGHILSLSQHLLGEVRGEHSSFAVEKAFPPALLHLYQQETLFRNNKVNILSIVIYIQVLKLCLKQCTTALTSPRTSITSPIFSSSSSSFCGV